MVCGSAFAIPANPEPFLEAQGDGTLVVLRARGDEHFSWLEDEDGYTVVRHQGWLHYAEKGADGRLKAGPHRVGLDNPAALGLAKRILPEPALRAKGQMSAPLASDTSSVTNPEAVASVGTLKNLTVLIRFNDHQGLPLPTNADYDVLFNAEDGDPVLAPTGSLKGVYREISYNQLTINSTVTGWHTVSNNESYYTADGENGGSPLGQQAMREALDLADQFIDFNDFDEDGDGYVDSLAFIHSGYGAEWGAHPTRFWSHRWVLVQQTGGNYYYNDWVSDEGVKVRDYHISTGLWGTSGTDIGRIGVIAHETGHYLGLPDLYDTDNGSNGTEIGSGIGSWGLMANSWGFDGEQYCPGHMSAWSKLQLGWVAPLLIMDPGPSTFTIAQAETSGHIYRLDEGFPAGEYLLIENRQPVGVDCSIPQGGLAIYHIDEAAGYNTQGYPGQTGWPGNGKHYRVALLQADGQYHLERNVNRGDAGDLHHAAAVDAIGPGPGGHPNTDTYQGGVISPTGHTIHNISASSSYMSFCVNGCANLPAPGQLAATATGNDTISLSWTDNSGSEDGFTLQHSPNGTSWSDEATLGSNVTNYADNGLVPGSTHFYRVRAFEGPSVSGWSNTASATTNQLPPAAPGSLSATGVSPSQIDLAWVDNSANETGFRVEVSTDGTSFTTLANRPAGTTTHSHTGLLANTTRHYRVYAVNAAGENVSNVASGTTLPPPPLVEYLAYAETHTSGTVSGSYPATHADDGSEQQITEQQSGGKPSNRTSYLEHAWRFNIGPGDTVTVNARARRSNNSEGDNFQFAWSTNGVNYTNLFVVNSATESSYQGSIPNTVSGEVYIRAIDTNRTPGNSATDSLWVDHLVIAVLNNGPPVAPNAPDNLVASSGGETSINLTWTDNANNEDGFRVERSADGSSAWSQVASLGANVTSWPNTGLTQNSTWFYRVLAFNGVGDSSWSNVASATTDDEPPPQAIMLSVNGYKVKGAKNYDLSWSGASGTSVDVYRDGVKVFTTANDGAHSYDSGEKGSGTHTHRVCELDSTTACSNIVSSTF